MRQDVWPFRNQSLALSEPKFGPFGTLWIFFSFMNKSLLIILRPVTYSVGNTINTRRYGGLLDIFAKCRYVTTLD